MHDPIGDAVEAILAQVEDLNLADRVTALAEALAMARADLAKAKPQSDD